MNVDAKETNIIFFIPEDRSNNFCLISSCIALRLFQNGVLYLALDLSPDTSYNIFDAY
jgi:hypothetical protein